jgi:hypothetical protein
MYSHERERGWDEKIGEALFGVLGFVLSLAFVTGFIALHVFIWIALAATDNAAVSAACGGDGRALWGALLAELLVSWAIVAGVAFIYDAKAFEGDKKACVGGTIFIYFLFSFAIVGVGIACRSSTRSPGCTDTLRTHSAGMDRALLVDLFDGFFIYHCVVMVVLVIMSLLISFCEEPDGSR